MPGGLTPQGYIPSTVDEEVADLNAKFLANIDGGLDLSPDQPMGEAVGIFAEKFAELTEAQSTIYNALNPSAAEAQLLKNVCAISGTFPQVATYSTVGANLTLSSGTTVAAGATAQVVGQPGNVWVLEADVVNSSGGLATLPGTFRSLNPGPQVANAGTLTVIGTPTVGWTAITNPFDAEQGLAADTDTTLRQKRNAELLGEGSGDVDAVRAAVLRVGGVIQCFVYENTSFVTDSTGLPGKSLRVLVWDGPGLAASNDAIAQAIWNSKPSGVLSYGVTATGNALDATGQVRTITFDRATQVPIYINVNTVAPALDSATKQGVKDALKAFALADWNLGTPVIWNSLFAPVYSVIGFSGTSKIFSLFVGTAPSPAGTSDIILTGLQIATLDTSNISIAP